MLRQAKVVPERTLWGFNGISRSVSTVLERKHRRFRRRIRRFRRQHIDTALALFGAAASVVLGVLVSQGGG